MLIKPTPLTTTPRRHLKYCDSDVRMCHFTCLAIFVFQFYQVYSVETQLRGCEAIAVLKPGAFIMSFTVSQTMGKYIAHISGVGPKLQQRKTVNYLT